jgi:hypothetical protein
MRRWLLDKDDHFAETQIPTRPTKDLLCTPKGQVLLLPGEKSVFALNAEYEAELARRRAALQKTLKDRDDFRQKIRELAGIRVKEEIPGETVRTAGTVKRTGYRIEKLVLERKDGVPLPALRFVPAKPNGEMYVYLHGEGKQADAKPGGPIETLVKLGNTVLAVDLSGLGETRRSRSPGQLGDWKNFYMAYLLGKSYVGIRAEDTLFAARYAATIRGKFSLRVHLVAVGEAAIPALHAAALEPAMFATVRLKGMIPSWRPVVAATETRNQLVNTVHAALEAYDLSDLITLAGSKTVTLELPADVMGKRRGQ